jgi:class 3 adenylate cyclase/tetratricopeptide (TPR) repeat protein
MLSNQTHGRAALSSRRTASTLARVTTCSRCGRESSGDAAFCPHCGAAQPAAPTQALEVRKTVTVLFCDVVGSTRLGEATDPETTRRVMSRYAESMSEVITAYGGTVERFRGDEVMAVFGVPVVHEDDALRAVRAGMQMQRRLAELNVELLETWGIELACRIGINTGEVVAGDPGTGDTFVTGDAVNLGKRLEQAAQPGEILIGTTTYPLVKDAVRVGPRERFTAKGKSSAVDRFRLEEVDATAAGYARRLDAPLIGRADELRRLEAAIATLVGQSRCGVVGVTGQAGIGKSRLVRELVARLGDEVTVLGGRCLPYGAGITYWPLVELVRDLGGLDAAANALERIDDAAEVLACLRTVVAQSDRINPNDEIFWAVRRLFEALARVRPLLVCLEDLHWAEPTMLDLVEYLESFSEGAIVVLCDARPELLEERPSWGRFSLSELEPLSQTETDELVSSLGVKDPAVRYRIAATAEGNPLFAEQLAVMVGESELDPMADDLELPASIQVLLAARLDGLEPTERRALERASVVGKEFWLRAIADLSSEEDRPQIGRTLLSLARKGLVQPVRADVPGEDTMRFRHALIRDVAYGAIPKSVRAETHESFAAWLESNAGEGFGDHDEIVGYHLEQSARLSQELGRPDAVLAARAGERLGAAGRRALWRGDNRAAAALLERAVELLRASRLDVALELDLASVQQAPPEAAAIAARAAEGARDAGDLSGEAAARVVDGFQRLLFGQGSPDEVDSLADVAIPLLEQANDDACLVHVWAAYGFGVANVRGQYAEWARAAGKCLRHARLAGQRPAHLFYLEVPLIVGPIPADEALATLDAALPEAPHPSVLIVRSQFLAMLGRFDEAWPNARQASDRLRELAAGPHAGGEYTLAEIAALDGKHALAAEYMEQYCDYLAEHGQQGLLSTFSPWLGRILCTLGRFDEAASRSELGRELGDEHDVLTQSLWRQVRARVDSHRGRHEDAERLAREAVAMIEQTDALNFQAAAHADLADVLAAAGRTAEAVAALEQALDRYERKRNASAAAQVRTRVEALREDT